jgi:predicted GIY-YIG superfamily endonuclease
MKRGNVGVIEKQNTPSYEFALDGVFQIKGDLLSGSTIPANSVAVPPWRERLLALDIRYEDAKVCHTCAGTGRELVPPRGTAVVYLHRNVSDHVIYVGITENFLKRMQGHKTKSAWWPDVVRIDARAFHDRTSAVEAEAALIDRLKPPHNIAPSERPDPLLIRARKLVR